MTPPNIHVDPAALRAAAREFDSQTGHVASLITNFTGPARVVDRAFGLLVPSGEVQLQYQEAVTTALGGLERLERALSDAAGKLRAGAANYEAADHPLGSGR